MNAESLPEGTLPAEVVPAQEHCLTSDFARADATGATAFSKSRLATDSAEGRFLATAETAGVWFGVSKVPLTVHTSGGKDALFKDVPPAVIDVLRLMCPELVVVL